MRKKDNNEKSQSLKPLVFYVILVFIVIFISLFIRIVSVVRESKFDGQHRFTLAVGSEKQALGFISFEPQTFSLSLMSFTDNSYMPFSLLNKKVGIIPDGFIKTRYPFILNGNIPSILQSFLFQSNNINYNITLYDLLRFWIYANKIPVSTISIQKIPVSSGAQIFDKTVALLFSDSSISAENVSIQIINATGQSGLGSRLERVISNLGGNVVSVETAIGSMPISKIQYYGRETYTLRKLNYLLPYRQEALNKKAIAEIIIIIGKDNKDTKLF